MNSRENKSGDKFTLQLASPLMLAGRVVIPAGTTGVGEVIDAEPAGFAGRAGKIVLAARYLDFDGRQIKLKAFKVGGEGHDNANLATAVVIAAGVAGMLVKGGNITYTVGARANAKLAADFIPAGTSSPPITSVEGKLK